MSKYPQSCFIVGRFMGVHPEVSISADFQKQSFAIDTEEDFNNIKVFEAHRTAIKDHIEQLRAFKKGDLVRVSFNIRSNKTNDGKWFTNVTAWKVQPYVAQDTDDFVEIEAAPAVVVIDGPSNQASTVDDLPF